MAKNVTKAARASETKKAVVNRPEPDAKRAVVSGSLLRRLSPFGRIIGAAVAGISLITGIIAIVPIFTRDATNFSSLRIEAEAFGSELEFGVPVNSPFDTFPSGKTAACTPEQLGWLEANGEPITTRYLVDLRNVASEGAMLALKSFRGEGETSNGEPLIKVVCDPSGTNPSQVQAARLLVSDPSEVAYFDKSAYNQSAEGIPDSPLVWNLSPGETGQVVLALFPKLSFRGHLEATAFSGTDQRDFPIPVGGADDVSVPGLAFGGMTFLQVNGSLQCIRLEGGDRVSCDISVLASE